MRRLAGFLVLVLLIAAAVISGGIWLRGELSRPYRGYSQTEKFVEIPRHTSRWRIAGILERAGIVHSRFAFLALAERYRRRVLQAGEYRFDNAMTPGQVFGEIAGGHIFVHVVTVPEGWTMFDIATELERQGLCSKENFLRVAHDPSLIRDIAPHAPSLEGFLFPSSYQFSRDATPEEIAATMVKQFREEWKKLQAAAPQSTPVLDPAVLRDAHKEARAELPALPPLTPEQIVTLASLIERETPQKSERPLVASVFYNRLRIGLPLQCDPTVQYALDLSGNPQLKITPQDLHISSPYNTYLHRGLPPGPIANPGDASLRAAMSPAQTKYLYFVANALGGHYFAATLAEHDRNITRYRRVLAGLPADPPPPPKKPAHLVPRVHHKSAERPARKAVKHSSKKVAKNRSGHHR